MAVGDGVGGAGFYAVSAEDTAGIIDVVNFRVAFASGDAVGVCVFGSFYVDAVCRTRRGAEKAAYAFLQAVLVAM